MRIFATLLSLLPALLPCAAVSSGEAETCWMRVTVVETEPNVPGTLTSMLFVRPAPATHLFCRKAIYGAEGQVVECKTGYHDVVNWGALKGVPETPVGEAGRWVDISKEAYAPYWTESRWAKTHRKYAKTTLHLGFFSRENDRRKDRRPIFKRLEKGNLDCVKVRVDFADAPEDRAIFHRYIIYYCHI